MLVEENEIDGSYDDVMVVDNNKEKKIFWFLDWIKEKKNQSLRRKNLLTHLSILLMMECFCFFFNCFKLKEVKNIYVEQQLHLHFEKKIGIIFEF
jgi:hypothetical protein